MHHVSGYRRLFFVLGLWVWVVALVLGCVMDSCICCGELICFRDYCIVLYLGDALCLGVLGG